MFFYSSLTAFIFCLAIMLPYLLSTFPGSIIHRHSPETSNLIGPDCLPTEWAESVQGLACETKNYLHQLCCVNYE